MKNMNKWILEKERDSVKEQLERLQNRLDRHEIGDYYVLIDAVKMQIRMIEELIEGVDK